MFIVYGSLFMI